jgi:RNA polymerase sigma-70 factor (ECF subfamily)
MVHLQVYCCSVIKNACIDYLRKDKLRTRIENQLGQAVMLSENAIERKYQEAELIQLLYERINQLPDRMQQVFKLTYLDGYSRAEIAQMLNLSENTIRNTNAAAMKALRLTLEHIMILIFLAFLFSLRH